MTTLAHPIISAPLAQLLDRVRRSRSLASMLPALLLSGVMTFVITAVMHAMWTGISGHWLESWLTAWPIAFPVAYIAGPLLTRMSAVISAPAMRAAEARQPGLAFGDIADASRSVTKRHGFAVLRGLKPAHDFNGV